MIARPGDVGAALALLLASRAAIVVVDAVAGAFVALNAASCHSCMPTGVDALDDWARWDTRWYIDIAQHGYSYDPNAQSSVAFFPLYPFLMRLAVLPFGTGALPLVIAGLVISNAALIGALVAIVQLARTEIDEAAAQRLPLLLLVFPSTVFLSAAYPESLMLLLAVVALHAARAGKWGRAGIFAALATLTKPFGIVVAAALLLEAARKRDMRRALPLAVAPLAGVAWWLYLTALTGEPWAFFLTQSLFRHRPALFGAVGDLFDPTVYGFPYLVAGLFTLVTVLVVVSWRRLSSTLAAQGTLLLAFMLAGGTLSSSMRYELNVIPALLVAASLTARRGVHVTVVAVSLGLALILAAMFSLQYWIG